MTFEEAVEIILEKEGGYVAHPSDPGGETKYGISRRSYPHLDIKNLTKDQAREIYLRDYWNRCALDAVPGSLRLIVFDAAVNHGPQAAIRMLQSSVGVVADGDFGPKTFKALQQADPEQVLISFAQRRLKLYMSLANFKTFGLGWLNRLLEVSIRSVA